MTCEEFRERVFGEPAEAAASEFEAHQASCAACSELFRAILHNENVLRNAAVPAPTDLLWGRIDRTIRSRRLFRRLTAAAAALLMAAVTFLLFQPGQSIPRGPELEVVEIRGDASHRMAALIPSFDGPGAQTRIAGALLTANRR